MTPELWNKIQEIFNDAAELPPDRREAFLTEHCRSETERQAVDRLLAAESDASGFLERPALELGRPTLPDRVAQYRIESEIGHGGMGTVFLGIRDDLGQRVAVKVIRRGMDSAAILRRFDAERKILATLEHPNIARLLDAGSNADGLPYYVMEFVDGVPIDIYCRGKSLTETLPIFQQVCSTVAFAHARLVVHRDLKPSNILVRRDGTIKLLDFGIAKVVEDSETENPGTATSLGMMTPNYASPEQFRGQTVTTATDIYSLGLIFYELLTGVLPYELTDKPLDEALAILDSSETIRPSRNPRASTPELSDVDLDNIALKALRRDPTRRYQSALEFSDDIGRYLEGRPVLARPDSISYRFGKFIRRNRIAVASTVLVGVTMIAALVVISQQYRIANGQRALAERRFAEVRELANKVVFRYHDEIAKHPGTTELRNELVTDAVKYLDALNSEDISDRDLKLELARAYQKIGDVEGRPYAPNLGRTDDALTSYQKSAGILENLVAASANEVAARRQLVECYGRIVAVKARLVNPEWLENIERALQLQNEIAELVPDEKLRNDVDLARVLILKGDYSAYQVPERIEIYRSAFAILEPIRNQSDEVFHDWLIVNQRLGSNYLWLGNEQERNGDRKSSDLSNRSALQFNDNLFAAARREIEIQGLNEKTRRVLAAGYQNLGENYIKVNDPGRGLEMLQKHLQFCEELAAADEKNVEARFDVANAWKSLADGYVKAGKISEAIESNARSISALETTLDLDPKNLEASQALVRMLDVRVRLLERGGRREVTSGIRKRILEMCGNTSNASACLEIGAL